MTFEGAGLMIVVFVLVFFLVDKDRFFIWWKFVLRSIAQFFTQIYMNCFVSS